MTFDAAERNRVGTRDVLVSRLGIGTSPFGTLVAAQGDEVVAATMEAAAAAGPRYFDTAPFYGYGLAQHPLGQGLRGTVRDEVVLSTKVGRLFKPSLTSPLPATRGGERPFAMVYDYTYDATLRSIEDSLLRLDSGRIDIALIHDVNRRWQGDQLEARYREAMAGAYSALDALRAQGVIKAIGVGVNDWEILLRFAADGDFDCFMLAGRYTLLDHSAIDRFLPECARRGIAVHGPMAAGEQRFALARDWLGAVPAVPLAGAARERALAELARRYLAAHGPATAADLATWAGLPLRDARAGLAAIASQVVVAGGGEFVDLAARRDGGDPPAAALEPRLLPAFDPYLLGWKDRRFAVPAAHAKRVYPGGGMLRAVATADGRAVGTWSARRRDGRLAVAVEPFGRIPAAVRAALAAEAADVARFEGLELAI